MIQPKHDILLLAAHGIVNFIIGIMTFVGIVMIAAVSLLPFNQTLIVSKLIESLPESAGSNLIGPIIAVLLVIVALLALGIAFLINLRKIILSVGESDPFAPINANRLARMGWIAVIAEVVLFFASVLAERTPQMVDDFDIDFAFSIDGGILALILFILARVFRHGAAMRSELEHTV